MTDKDERNKDKDNGDNNEAENKKGGADEHETNEAEDRTKEDEGEEDKSTIKARIPRTVTKMGMMRMVTTWTGHMRLRTETTRTTRTSK